MLNTIVCMLTSIFFYGDSLQAFSENEKGLENVEWPTEPF